MNNQEHRYTLETPRLTHRRQQKTTCPQCGRHKCFVRYVDLKNQCRYLSNEVGKCDHQHSCGYHYRPSEYFRDNPSQRERYKDNDLACTPIVTPCEQPLIPLDAALVARSHSAMSTFWQWVEKAASRIGATTADVRRVYDAYCLGATHQSDVIFWQIDEHGLVHTGHVMCYDPQGHRQGYQSWVHYLLKQKGLLPLDYQPPKCYFGQHLLTGQPEATVCIVESEKTALVMALAQPDYLWLATAGCGGLSPEKTRCLKGHRVLLFPDSGCLTKWREKMQQTEGIDYTISEQLEAYPPNTDLADLLLG